VQKPEKKVVKSVANTEAREGLEDKTFHGPYTYARQSIGVHFSAEESLHLRPNDHNTLCLPLGLSINWLSVSIAAPGYSQRS